MSKPNFLNSTVIGLSLTAISVTSVTLALQLGSKVELLDSQIGTQKVEIALLHANVEAVRREFPNYTPQQENIAQAPSEISEETNPHISPAHHREIRREEHTRNDPLHAVVAQFKDSMCGLTSDINATSCVTLVSRVRQ